MAQEIALGRIPRSDELAGAALFSASDRSSLVGGQSLDVNGGQVMQ